MLRSVRRRSDMTLRRVSAVSPCRRGSDGLIYANRMFSEPLLAPEYLRSSLDLGQGSRFFWGTRSLCEDEYITISSANAMERDMRGRPQITSAAHGFSSL